MKLRVFFVLLGMSTLILAAATPRMEARVYVESPEQATAKLGDLLGELDICTVDRTEGGREFLVINTDATQLAAIRATGVKVEVTWPDIREKFRKMTGVDPDNIDAGRNFGYFFTYWEMIDTLRRLASLYPAIVDTFKLGPSFQNRALWGLRISDNPTVDEAEPEIFINGATHAREPLGTHACIHFAQLLCRNFGTDSLVTWLVRNREFYIVPVMNPDGYVYNSDSGGASSNWRKNRRGPVPPAIGIDLNRNYGYKWGYDNSGSSPTPSNETYRGPSRFSEPETRAVRNFTYQHKFRTCQDFHTYGRYNLYAWGYYNPMPPDSLVLKEMGDTFEVNNGYTQTGPIYRTIYPTNGGSTDYAQADTLKDSTNESKFITYGFSTELGRTDFWYGWDRPAYVDSEVTKNIPNLYYLARVSGVFFDPVRATVNDSALGNRTLQLDPNETADLWFRVKNRAIHPLDSAYSITGRLRSLDTMVTVLDSIKSFPRSLRRDSTDNRAAQFRVFCRRGATPGQVVPLRLELTYRDDTLTMMQPVAFTVTIGSNPIYIHDVGCSHLLAPSGVVDSGAIVVPACSVYNYGDIAESYTVRMRVGPYNRTASVSNHAAGTRLYVTFAAWTAGARGSYAVGCSTELATDTVAGNNKAGGTVTVNVTDVACTRILAPAGSVDSGAVVTPACSVYNHGSTTPSSYTVRMRIGSGYNRTATVTGHAPGTAAYVTFPGWTASPPGNYAVSCSTELAGDQVLANDKATGSVDVVLSDIGVVAILAPTGTIPPGVVTPSATLHNYGRQRDAATVTFTIGPAYAETLSLPAGLPFADTALFFPSWTASAGTFSTRCSTWMATDQYPANNVFFGSVVVSESGGGGGGGWTARTPMPAGAKPCKDGAWLTYDASKSRIYASRGNKQPDFFAYEPVGDSWGIRAPWQPGSEAKLPQKGSAGCADGNGAVYATKGNNTAGFWKYEASTNAWAQKKDVPLGVSNKKVKGGTDITWAYNGGVGAAYLLKGYKNEFYKYIPVGDSWSTLTPAPVGSNQKWDKGSWLAYDDANNRVYAFKAKYMEFYRYTPDGDSWSAPLAPMPVTGSTGNKKAKAGSCGTYCDGSIYALKGGNTQQFFRYAIATNTWAELDTIPKGVEKKKANAGTDITTAGGVLYALKGNKSNQLWQYGFGLAVSEPWWRDGVAASSSIVHRSWLIVSPNPLIGGLATVRFDKPVPGPVRLEVIDVTGRVVLQSPLATRHSSFALDLRSMPAGVYLVKLSGDGFADSQKLVVQR